MPAFCENDLRMSNRRARALLAIYNRNVFPELKVTWGTYLNNLGHTEFPDAFDVMTALT